MPDPTFQLIFDSRRVAVKDGDSVKARLRTHLGMKETALARLFCGRPVVIRRDLGADRAKRFAGRLAALGAPCRIVAQSPPGRPSEIHLSDSLVVCPKCHHNQTPAAECCRCGLIFDKYRADRPAPSPPEPDHTAEEPNLDTKRQDPPPDTFTPTAFRWVHATLIAVKTRLLPTFGGRGRRKRPLPATQSKAAPAYVSRVLSQAFRALLYAALSLVLLVVGIWFARGLWGLYTATHVGQRYLADFPDKSQTIIGLLNQHSLVLPVATILVTLLLCAAVATVAHFLHLGRLLYENRPWWWRLLIWYLPLSATVGNILVTIGLAPNLKLGAGLALLPTLCLAPVSFALGQTLICEAGDLLARLGQATFLQPLTQLRSRAHQPIQQLRERIASHLDR